MCFLFTTKAFQTLEKFHKISRKVFLHSSKNRFNYRISQLVCAEKSTAYKIISNGLFCEYHFGFLRFPVIATRQLINVQLVWDPHVFYREFDSDELKYAMFWAEKRYTCSFRSSSCALRELFVFFGFSPTCMPKPNRRAGAKKKRTRTMSTREGS